MTRCVVNLLNSGSLLGVGCCHDAMIEPRRSNTVVKKRFETTIDRVQGFRISQTQPNPPTKKMAAWEWRCWFSDEEGVNAVPLGGSDTAIEERTGPCTFPLHLRLVCPA